MKNCIKGRVSYSVPIVFIFCLMLVFTGQPGVLAADQPPPELPPKSQDSTSPTGTGVYYTGSAVLGEDGFVIDSVMPETEYHLLTDKRDITSYTSAGWVSIMFEGFEGVFPSAYWNVYDADGATNGEYYWDDDDFIPRDGSWSAWVANGGADGRDPEYWGYPAYMDSWMVYGPFDLSNANAAALTFHHLTVTDDTNDYFWWMASSDGAYFAGTGFTGNSDGWQFVTMDLTSVPVLGDLTGDSSVWIAFRFVSDSSGGSWGTWVDTINLIKYVGAIDTIGLYNPTYAAYNLKTANEGGAPDIVFQYGATDPSWVPLMGDWDGNGIDTVGVYVPSTSTFFLKDSNAGGASDYSIQYGPPGAGWIPLAGDWDGDGDDTLGLFDPNYSAFFLANELAGGAIPPVFYGAPGLGWTPLVGDWDGDGDDTLGLFDPTYSVFYLSNELVGGSTPPIFYGASGWTPIVGDWDDDGDDTIGVYVPSTSIFFLKNSNETGASDIGFQYGPPGAGWIPLTGNFE